MIKRILGFFLNTGTGSGLAVILIVGFAYWLGGHNASNSIKKETALITDVVSNVNQQYDADVTKINDDFIKEQLKIMEQSDGLQSRANYWGDIIDSVDYRMSIIPKHQSDELSTGTTDSQYPEKNECLVYQAEFSREAISFSKSEARRADYCAVQLIEANATIDNLIKSIDDYNANLKARGVVTENLIKRK